MFDNIGRKIKGLAKVVCWIGIIASVLCAFILWSQNSYRMPTIGTGFIVLIIGTLGSWICSWALYAFGQITDDIHAMRTANDISTMRPKYRQATAYMKQKKYDEAISLFEEISSFEDAASLMQECLYCKATEQKKAGKYQDAIRTFKSADSYKDAETQILECWYQIGTARLAEKRYDDAYEAFASADDYQNTDAMLEEVRYLQAKAFAANGDKVAAFDLFACMLDYKDVRKIVTSDPALRKMLDEMEQEKQADEN